MIWLLKDFDFLSVLLRGALLSLEALTLGGVFFFLFVAVPGSVTAQQVAVVRTHLVRLSWMFAFVQAASIALSVAILTGSSGLPVFSLVSASFFVAGAAGVAGSLLLIAWLQFAPRRIGRIGTLLPAAVILLASVAQSHAASRLEDRKLLLVLTALHHLGTAGWVGAMLFLLFTLRLSPSLAAAQQVVRRYSALALVSVPTLILAGFGLGWFYIGSWGGVYGTTYGLMVLAKTYLLLCMLLLGVGNYRLMRLKKGTNAVADSTQLQPVSAGGPGFLVRLRRFSEAEIGLGLTAILAAASLTSQPPAVDLGQNRLTWHQIVERTRWTAPRLTSPPIAQLATPTTTAAQSVAIGQYSAGAVSDANDRAWSEYNHHWAGLIVLCAAVLAFAAGALPTGRARRFASNWPLLFLGLGVFILLRADPENWPLGPRSFWQSFAAPDVLQHRLYALLIACFAFFEWAVATRRWRSARAAYVFPLLCAAGGAALLTHTHGLSNMQEEVLAELVHTPIAVLGATAGWGRWLQLRLPGTRAAKVAGLVWPLALALAGLLLLDYRES